MPQRYCYPATAGSEVSRLLDMVAGRGVADGHASPEYVRQVELRQRAIAEVRRIQRTTHYRPQTSGRGRLAPAPAFCSSRSSLLDISRATARSAASMRMPVLRRNPHTTRFATHHLPKHVPWRRSHPGVRDEVGRRLRLTVGTLGFGLHRATQRSGWHEVRLLIVLAARKLHAGQLAPITTSVYGAPVVIMT